MKTLRGLIPPLIAILMVAGLWSITQVNVGRAAPSGIIVNVVQTTIADFNRGSFYLTGMTRNGDGEVTLLQQGIAGQWITTTNFTGLTPRLEHAAIAYNNRLYVFGGRGSSGGLRSIQFTSINTTTHDVSNWTTAATTLTTTIYTYPGAASGVAGLSAVELGGRVYLLGGHDGTQTYHYNTVSFATIDPNTGELGPLIATTPLPQALSNGQAVVMNDRIYYLGGVFTQSIQCTNAVYYAVPDPVTGLITTWYTTTSPLPYNTFGQMAVATVNGRLYSMAGISNTIFNGSVPSVYYAQPVAASGDITGWVQATELPRSIFDGAAVTFGGQIYDTGGALDLAISTPSNYVVAGIDALNTGVTGWVATSGITPSRLLHTAVVNSDGWLYVIGGSSGANQPIQQNIINAAATTGQAGAAYAPDGYFLSAPFDLGKNYILHQLSWVTTLPSTSTVTATLRYRYALGGSAYTSWSAQFPANNALGTSTTTLPITGTARYLQYQVFFTTTEPLATPVLNQVGLQYEMPTPPTFQKSANPPGGGNVNPGDRITYTLTYSNVNDNNLTNVVILDTAPISTTYVAGSIFGSPGVITNDLGAPQLSWTITTLPAHTGGTIGFVVTVNNDAPEGNFIYNIANFDSDQVATRSSQVSHMIGMPLTFIKSHTSSAPPQAFGRVQPGDLVTYTLIYSNPSPTRSYTSTIVTDILPISITYLGYSGTPAPSVSLINGQQVLQWPVGTIPAQTGGTVGFYAQVLPNMAFVPDGGSINNTAQVGTFGRAPISSNTDIVPIRYRFDMLLSIDDGVTKAPPGSLLTYTIRITNVTSMPITPTGIVIYDYLEPGRPGNQPGVLKCAAPCTGWAFDSISEDGSQVYSRIIPFLGPNQSTVVTMAAQISPTLWTDAPGVLTAANKAYAIDDGQHGAEINPINQVAEDADIVSGQDIVVTDLHAASNIVVPGKPAQFVVTLYNNGFTPTLSSDGSGWFGVDLYVKPSGSPPPAGPADRYLGYCLDASNYPCTLQDSHYQTVGYPSGSLAADATSQVTYTLSITSVGTYWLYVQADPYWAGPTAPYTGGTPANGRVVEGNETNNIFGPLMIKVDYGKVYLPLVLKVGYVKVYLPLVLKSSH